MRFYCHPSQCYQKFAEKSNCFQSIFLLLIRLYWGFHFFQSGWSKLSNIPQTASFFGEIGIPFPSLSVYLAGGTEFIGGILLIIGLASRLAAIPLAFTMIVAYFTAHYDSIKTIFSDFSEFIKQEPFTYLFICLIILFFGPGKISLDYLICKKNTI